MSLKINEEIERLGRENSLPILWAFQAPGGRGKVLLKRGKAAEGVGYLRSALALWDSAGAKVYSPYAKTILAEGMAMLGELDNSLQLIQEQIDQVERIGWEEQYYYSESLRIKAWILTLKDDADGAEEAYLSSLDSAREQQAKSWELRTSTSLARLWQGQGKVKEAHQLLAPVYNWFTEGFGTKDLTDAKALLEELAA